MFPPMGDGHLLAGFVLQQTQVLAAFARCDPQDLSGYAHTYIHAYILT